MVLFCRPPVPVFPAVGHGRFPVGLTKTRWRFRWIRRHSEKYINPICDIRSERDHRSRQSTSPHPLSRHTSHSAHKVHWTRKGERRRLRYHFQLAPLTFLQTLPRHRYWLDLWVISGQKLRFNNMTSTVNLTYGIGSLANWKYRISRPRTIDTDYL